MQMFTQLKNHFSIVQVFIIVFVTLSVNLLLKRFLVKLCDKLKHTRTYWDDAIAEAARKPLAWAVWVVGLSFAATVIGEESGAAIFDAVPPLRHIALVILFAWFLVRFCSNAENNFIANRKAAGKAVDLTTVDAVAKLLRISVIITTALVLLQSLGYSVSGVLAFGGVGGIAVGFAAKDMLANLFGGLMIYLDRPFNIGDWIRSPDKEIEGTVRRIGWRMTSIMTFDKRPLYVPNAVFTNISVENPSRMENRRIYETMGIRYGDAAKMAAIIADVRKMLQTHEEIDAQRTLIVNFDAFAPSSLDFFIYTFTKTTDWIKFHHIKQDVLLKIVEIVGSHGAEFAYPTSTLSIPDKISITQD